MIVITADVGGTKTTVAITRDGERLIQIRGGGAAVRPGRALISATAIADLVRSALAQAHLLRADALVVGAAGAGRVSDAEEIRSALGREHIADRVMVVSDVALALAALGESIGVVLVAGTGSVAIGRTTDGQTVRQGGLGWQMGDEGGGYWIGREGLRAVGLAEDGRGPATSLSATLLKAAGAADFRDLVGWSTIASPREVASLCPTVVAAAEDGDEVAGRIVQSAAAELAGLVNRLAERFAGTRSVAVGVTGGLLSEDGLLGRSVAALLEPPFTLREGVIDPLLGGPRVLSAAP